MTSGMIFMAIFAAVVVTTGAMICWLWNGITDFNYDDEEEKKWPND